MDARNRAPQQLRGSQLVPMLLHALQTAASRAQNSSHAISKPTSTAATTAMPSTSGGGAGSQITRAVTNEELFYAPAEPAPNPITSTVESPTTLTTNTIIQNDAAGSPSPQQGTEDASKKPGSPGSPSSTRKTKLSFLFGESTSSDEDGGSSEPSKQKSTTDGQIAGEVIASSPAPSQPEQRDVQPTHDDGASSKNPKEQQKQASEAESSADHEEKEEEGDEAEESQGNSHTAGDAHRSLHESAKHFKKRRPYSDDDLAFILRLLRSIAECTVQPAGCEDVALMGPEVDKMLELLMPVVKVDVRVAMFTCCVVGSLCATPVSRMQVNQQLAVSTIMGVLDAYSHERRVVHLALMMLSNVALCENGVFTRSACDFLVRVVFPFYTEAHVVEAWTAALCNITAIHPQTVQPFIEAGLVDAMERIVLFLGDDSRVASRGLQCLSNLSIGFTAGQPPTSLVG